MVAKKVMLETTNQGHRAGPLFYVTWVGLYREVQVTLWWLGLVDWVWGFEPLLL